MNDPIPESKGGERQGVWRRVVHDLASVRLRDDAGVTVAAIDGEVDISNAELVLGALTELPNLADGLIVDLRDLAFIDSSGIALLHELAERLRQRSQRLLVVCPPEAPPRRVLELTGLPARIPVLDELETAMRTVRDRAGEQEPGGAV